KVERAKEATFERVLMDRLSQLPDDLLIKILSFVPTKDDVAMSILSKRWQSLRTLVPRVIFDDFSEEDSDEDEEGNENHAIRSLSQFVFGTLLLHKAAVLERFHLNTTSECSLSQIGLWVRIAVDRFVHNLKISSFITITVLFCFRMTNLSPRLISNCFVLEELVVETCHKDNVVTFTVDLPSLKSLSVGNTIRENPPDDHMFVIRSQSLKRLRIVDYFGELDFIGNLLKLVDDHGMLADRKVRKVRKVRWIQPRRVPVCLFLHLKSFEWRDYEGTKVEKEVAIYILNNAKRLVTAAIYPFSVSLVRKRQKIEEVEIAIRTSRECGLTIG
ncbi:hypothetical protein DY000_02032273, partial [Brassica cretica]